MKLTKKLEAEIKALMDDYWNSYMKGDLKHWGKYLPDDYRNIGGTKEEIWNSKKEILDYTKAITDQMVGMADIRNKTMQIIPYDPYFMVHEFMDMFIKVEGKFTFYGKFRLSSLIEKTAKGWKVLHQHGSYPDSKTEEGEAFAFDEIKAENIKLKDAVQRRTIELEDKNRELEIETALEKVRVIAMGMKEPKDMLDVCKTIAQQLQSLGVEEIRNVQTAIFYESRGTYMNYEYYAKHRKTIITETSYTNNKMHKAFANQMLKGKDEFFTSHIKGKKVKEWLAYQKTTNVFIDKYLSTASSLTYYWDSLGPVALGISTYVPLNKAGLDLFKRFRNVFELAYTRYLDIEQALAQAKEAQVEASLERVRAQAMAMHQQDDLLNICETFYKEFNSLGFDGLRNAMINIYNDEQKTFVNYDYSDVIGKSINHLTYNIHPEIEKQVKQVRKANDAFSETVFKGKGLENMKKFRKKIGEKEDPRIKNCKALYYYFYSIGSGAIGISTFNPVTEEKLELLKRFRNVFTLSYQRYTDIALAEAQAREAEIELALERVRARTMAMQKSDELNETSLLLFEQLKNLGQTAAQLSIGIIKEDKGVFELSATVHGTSLLQTYDVPLNEPFVIKKAVKAWKQKKKTFTIELKGKELTAYNNWRNSVLKKKIIFPEKQWIINIIFFSKGMLSFSADKEISKETFQLLERFAGVFDGTYTRFLDLQKAEAQIRETQIEVGLERVRSRSLAMHNTSELQDIINTVHKELLHLNIAIDGGSFIAINSDIETELRCWGSGGTANTTEEIHIPLYKKPFCTNIINSIKNGPGFFTEEFTQKEKRDFFTFLFKHEPWKKLTAKQKKETLSSPGGYTRSCLVSKHTSIFIINHIGEIFSSVDNDILKRFGKVFEQAYTRFLDLQKAEAQTRESQIGLGLERVRARAMAMQHSDELSQLVDTVFKELANLDFALNWCIINIIDEPSFTNMVWAANPETNKPPESYLMKFEDYPFHHSMMKGYQQRKAKHVYVIEGKEKKEYDEYLFTETEWRRVPKKAQAASKAMKRYVASFTFSNFGGLQTVGEEPLSEENLDILSRFGKVFDLTYTRFNDLQKAEAQAREAEIELALERVRARTMAMQKSDELAEAASILFQQLQQLGIHCYSSGFTIWDEDHDELISWMCNADGSMNPPFKLPLTDTSWHKEQYQSWKNKEEFAVKDFTGKAMQNHFQYLRSFPLLDEAFKKSIAAGHPMPKRQVHHVANFSFGNLLFITLEPCSESHEIFKRFAKVFDQTYTRFLDLQKAEAQAREAEIELALERVRARTMAMQHSDELADASFLLDEQIRRLGIKTRGCAFNIYGEKESTEWFSNEMGTMHTYKTPRVKVFLDYYEAGQKGEIFLTKEFSGKECIDWYNYLCTLPVLGDGLKQMIAAGGSFPTRQIDHVAFFKYGYLLFLTFEPVPEAHDIFKRFAKVFEQTYTRFLDLQKAEAQAREAKIETSLERVRSRSMAMHKSDELKEAGELLWNELSKLGIQSLSSGYVLMDKEEKIGWTYAPNPATGKIAEPLGCLHTETKEMLAVLSGWKKQDPLCVVEMNEQDTIAHQTFIAEQALNLDGTICRWITAEQLIALSPKRLFLHNFNFKQGYLLIVGGDRLTDEQIELMLRFTNVFQQTYTRFLDLQKAEAQAREAQIETALEKVRSRSMGMQKSEELKEVIQVVYDQFVHLNIKVEHTGFVMDYKTRDDHHLWIADPLGVPSQVTIPYFDSVYYNRFNEAKEKGENFFVTNLTFEEKNRFYQKLFEYVPGLPDESKKFYFNCPGLAASTVLLENVGLYIENFSGIAFSDADNEILMRFGKVFQQTYTRFLDLQKAEAQAREAQIENALEKVRSRTMAMQRSEELPEAANNLFLQVQALGIPAWSAGYCIWNEDKTAATAFMSSEGVLQKPFVWPSVGVGYNFYEPFQKGEPFAVQELGDEEIVRHYEFMRTLPVFGEVIDGIMEAGFPLPTFQIFHFVYFPQGFLMFITYEPVLQSHDIFKRFAKVFEQTYTRFLDLQKAETQSRENQIQLALERARTQSMIMQHSNELDDTLRVFHEQVLLLGINSAFSFLWLPDEEKSNHIFWAAWEEEKNDSTCFKSKAITYPLDRNEPATAQCLLDWKSDEPVHSYAVKPAEVENYFAAWAELLDGIEKLKPEFFRDGLYYVEAFMKYGCFGVMLENDLSDEEKNILYRFSVEFERTYTRFLDLQKAEAQAREATIEAALERVRSRSMAMHKSDEMLDVIEVVSEQLQQLNLNFDTVSFAKNNQEGNFTFWITSKGQPRPVLMQVPPLDSVVQNRVKEAKQKGGSFFTDVLTADENREWSQHLIDYSEFKFFPEKVKDFVLNSPGFARSSFLLKNIDLYLGNYRAVPFTDEENAIFKRFAQVFEQSYTRFLDLQKAEAQAREAQIEMALEKVRSRTMAMQRSDELSGTAALLFQEFQKLEQQELIQTTIGIYNEEKNEIEFRATDWTGSGEQVNKPSYGSMDEPTLLKPAVTAWRAHARSVVIELTGEALEKWTNYRNKMTGTSIATKFDGGRRIVSISFFSKGHLSMSSPLPIPPEAVKTLERFAAVFDGTYTRFLDLQKAEAQAREAQIEAGLERVRSRTLAMQNSDELAETSVVVFKQLIELGIEPNRLYIGIIKDDSGDIEFWATDEDGTKISSKFTGNKNRNASVKKMYDNWAAQEKSLTIDMQGKELEDYFHYLGDVMHVPFKQGLLQKRRVQTMSFFSKGFIGIASPDEQPEATTKLLERFAAVFNLTYTRFNDLQVAEAQTREAKIETALERVRARALAMQQPEELKAVAEVLRHEMGLLGVEELETCSIYINDEKAENAECWYALKDLRSEEKKLVNDHFALNLNDTWVGREMLKFYQSKLNQVSIIMQGANRVEWIRYCEANSAPFRGYYGDEIPDRTYHLYKFSHGAIGAASAGDISAESWSLLKRAASVFSLAYSRFKDLTQARVDLQRLKEEKQKAEDALTNLQAAQKQLVQSEKMASLGELTAGIAHEIQNPLNFVNNFSEVSKELLDEMKEEMEKGNLDDVREIMKDVIQNLEKINHHGKRADGIVKGMLQHSRSSSGVKEPTDINALCDEYLRLSYHGLRAKDKSFNAAMKTDFDKSIDNINIIPQDIGRVVLNLLTNAFYVVDEKKKQNPEGYEPTVTIATCYIQPPSGGRAVAIKVSDNGGGIPQKVLDKIFQPFFTTKPTGQGTGLGLSLSYDIVTKGHGGELKVETKEGEGTEFVIVLPV